MRHHGILSLVNSVDCDVASPMEVPNITLKHKKVKLLNNLKKSHINIQASQVGKLFTKKHKLCKNSISMNWL